LDPVGTLPTVEEAAFIEQGSTVGGRRPICEVVQHPIAGARESVVEITLSEWDGAGSAHLSVADLRGDLLAVLENAEAGDALTVRLRRSGEALVRLAPSNPEEAANGYRLGVHCLEGCEAEYTRHPVVLFHGLGRADGLEDRENFYGVRAEMAVLGYAVYEPTVSPFDGWASRAREWESHLDALVEAGAGRRFNIIAHSLGGLDARYLISVLERVDLVASLITIGTPHRGTLLADLATGVVEGHPASAVWVDLSASVFALFFGGADDDLSLVQAMSSLTTSALDDLNEMAPDDDDVYYASWTGRTCSRFDDACQATCPGETVHPLLAAGFTILRLDGTANDGMVPAPSTVWGDHRGTVCADHADQVGLFADGETDAYDHVAFYRSELRRLADLGF